MNIYVAGIDIGQAKDPTAIAIAERRIPPGEHLPHYLFGHVQRLPLGTLYPDVVKYVTSLLSRPPFRGKTTVALDYTGVGRPVADMFLQEDFPCDLYLVSIHGGTAVSRDGIVFGVPKRDLIASAQVLFQSKRLKIASTLPDTPALISELQNFHVKIDSQTAHDSYSAWREGIHDDLVFAVALATWIDIAPIPTAGVWGEG